MPFYIQLEDTGRYSCLANSPAGDDDKEFLVRVHGEFQKKKKRYVTQSEVIHFKTSCIQFYLIYPNNCDMKVSQWPFLSCSSSS